MDRATISKLSIPLNNWRCEFSGKSRQCAPPRITKWAKPEECGPQCNPCGISERAFYRAARLAGASVLVVSVTPPHEYERVVSARAAVVDVTRDQLRRAFHDLVLPDALLDQLGPSLIAHQSLFLYGDTGSGKSSIALRILRVYEDPVVVPHAVQVDGHIISILDPNVHKLASRLWHERRFRIRA